MTIFEPDETMLTPVSSPRVSDDPVTTLVGRISSELNSVIDRETTFGCREDTSSVELPWLSISADGERGRSECIVDGHLASGNRGNGGHGKFGFALRLPAGSISCGVRVASFGILTTLLLNPVDSLTRITSVAASIGSVAVHNFLRSEGHNVLTSDQVGGLYGLSGGESPARSALSLVLDGSGHSFGNPVNSSSRGSNRWDVLGGRLIRAETKELLELLSTPVSELRVSEGSGGLVLVEFDDLVSGKNEVAEALGTFLVGVGLVPELDIFVESIACR